MKCNLYNKYSKNRLRKVADSVYVKKKTSDVGKQTHDVTVLRVLDGKKERDGETGNDGADNSDKT